MAHYKDFEGKLKNRELAAEFIVSVCKMLEFWELSYSFIVNEKKIGRMISRSLDLLPSTSMDIDMTYSVLTINFCPKDSWWINPFDFILGDDNSEVFGWSGFQIRSCGDIHVKEETDVFMSLYIYFSKWFDVEIWDSHDDENTCALDFNLINFGNMEPCYRDSMREKYFALRDTAEGHEEWEPIQTQDAFGQEPLPNRPPECCWWCELRYQDEHNGALDFTRTSWLPELKEYSICHPYTLHHWLSKRYPDCFSSIDIFSISVFARYFTYNPQMTLEMVKEYFDRFVNGRVERRFRPIDEYWHD